MEGSTPRDKPDASDRPLDEFGALRALVDAIKTRILSGLLLALPIAITMWIVVTLFSYLKLYALDPSARLVKSLVGDRLGDLPGWWLNFASPLIALGLVLVVLYILGYFVRTRLALALDWVLLRLPLVTIIYKNVRSVFQSLGGPGQSQRFKRVVLVDFPHPGVRSLGFVTKSLRDADTQKTILCVCVLTGVVPPAGFTFFVPEEHVTDLDWTVQETIQAIVSGGITSPSIIRYSTGGPTKLIVPGRLDEPDAEPESVGG